MNSKILLTLCLLNIKGLGPVRVKRLLQQSEEAGVFLKNHPERDQAQALADKELEWAKRLNVTLISYDDPTYPSAFKELDDAPLLLYMAGDLKGLSNCLGIIGTRQATTYGREMATRFGEVLAEQGVSIVSGLARGIDTCAHQGALKTGKTIAILGSGLANIYPAENKELARKIAASGGALISEFPLGAPPHAYHFPRRNRLVSALSQGLLLVEAPLKSGAMGTMEIARNQNRPLFALPGRADLENFRGNHALIKKGWARLVEEPLEIIEALGLESKPTSYTQPPASRSHCTAEELHLLSFFPSGEISFDTLSALTQLPPALLNKLVMSLILKGIIKECPGKNLIV